VASVPSATVTTLAPSSVNSFVEAAALAFFLSLAAAFFAAFFLALGSAADFATPANDAAFFFLGGIARRWPPASIPKASTAQTPARRLACWTEFTETLPRREYMACRALGQLQSTLPQRGEHGA
jgi:hypothetical protein